MTCKLTNWITDWLTDWLNEWAVDWLTDLKTDCLVKREIKCLTHWMTDWLPNLQIWPIDWLTDLQTDWLIYWMTCRLSNWLTDSQTDLQVDWLTYRQTDWLREWSIVTHWMTDLFEITSLNFVAAKQANLNAKFASTNHLVSFIFYRHIYQQTLDITGNFYRVMLGA